MGVEMNNYDDRRPLKATRLRAGFGIFFEDQTGEDRPQEQIDKMMAQFEMVAEAYNFSIQSHGDFHSFVLFFGRAYMDELMYNLQHGDLEAQRTRTNVQEALEELEGREDQTEQVKEAIGVLKDILEVE